MIILSDVYKARKRVQRWARRTPFEYSEYLSDYCNGKIWLKLENQQLTHSFKLRGATNKILSLTEEERTRGIVTASAGNHAQGVGYIARELGIKAKIICPLQTPKVKLDAIRKYGVELIVEGEEYLESEQIARRYEREEGMTFVSAYNDLELIKGQATIGLEMMEDQPDLDQVVIPVGGGGLASGVASVFKQTSNVKTIGVQSIASPVMYECIKKGEIFEMPLKDSYAEGLHGGLEPGSITFDICREVIDYWIILEEEEILTGIKAMLHKQHMLIEGAGAVGPAAVLAYPECFNDKKTGIVISGGNISERILKMIV